MTVPLVESAAATTESVIPIITLADDDLLTRDVDEAAPSIARLHVATRELTVARSALDTTFAGLMPRGAAGDEYVGDGFVIRRRGGTTRTSWDPALWSAVREKIKDRALLDRPLGTDADVELIDLTLDWVAEVINTSGRNMRTRVLRSWSINPDRYSESTPSGYRIEVL